MSALFFMHNMKETGYSRNQYKQHQADVNVKHTLLGQSPCCQVKIDEDILDNKDVCCNKRCAEKVTYRAPADTQTVWNLAKVLLE